MISWLKDFFNTKVGKTQTERGIEMLLHLNTGIGKLREENPKIFRELKFLRALYDYDTKHKTTFMYNQIPSYERTRLDGGAYGMSITKLWLKYKTHVEKYKYSKFYEF